MRPISDDVYFFLFLDRPFVARSESGIPEVTNCPEQGKR